MRIIVAGGAGFIGSHLCERLLGEGHVVVCLDNFVTGDRRNLAGFAEHDRFTFIEADVTKSIPVDGPVDRIFHLASPASPIDYVELPFATLYAGSDATRLMLDKALQTGARFFLASTSEVYGDPAVHPQVESYFGNVNPIGPRSVYDEAKRFAEAMTMAYHRYHGVDTRIVRIFNTYGPRMRLNDGRALPAFMSQALRGEPVTVFGDGLQTRSFCYVDDMVDGIHRLLMSDEDFPVNLGNPAEMSMLDFARKVIELTGSSSAVTFQSLPVDDPKVRQPDITKARRTLGWEPKVDLHEGLGVTLKYFRERLSTSTEPA